MFPMEFPNQIRRNLLLRNELGQESANSVVARPVCGGSLFPWL